MKTDLELNELLAEGVGWQRRKGGDWLDPNSGEVTSYIPNYCGDLNAVRDLEPADYTARYWWNLVIICCEDDGRSVPVNTLLTQLHWVLVARARAKQRVRAYLKWQGYST